MNHYPTFYHPDRVGTLYVPDTAAAIAQGQTAGVPPADAAERRVLLLLVDPQVDFVHADGALSVPGAVADMRRTIEWLLAHMPEVTAVAVSLDSHVPIQIFYPTWWVNPAGQPPEPFTTITSRDVEHGHWVPRFEPHWSVRYVYELETRARKSLMIWPFHTMIGTPGHAVTPALYEALMYHAAARHTAPYFLFKGSIPKTEHYSILEPEVKVPDHPQGELNVTFLNLLADYDLIYVAGQAKSHCVLETITSVMAHYRQQAGQIAKWRILMDCTSSVTHPEIDFDAIADNTLQQYATQGLRLVRSTDPIE